MKWRDTWDDQFKFHDFFALVPHRCGAMGCENMFWLERGRRRRQRVLYAYTALAMGAPNEFRCNRCGSMGEPGV